MATFIAISTKTQTRGTMKRSLDYVMQQKKIVYQNPETGQSYQLISGQNCMPETAYTEFMNTKEQYRKAHGVFFKHYVQSFKPDCGATPDHIHQMGVELAKQFIGFEVVIATHIDADHWHNHLIVNSVSCETGLKIQINEDGLERLRNQSDEICKQFGVEVLPPYQKPQQRAMNQREYRTALKGESWKMKLLSAIDKVMKASGSKDQFIHNMESIGYGVKWVDHYKYITYTTPEGKKCRDNRLFENKYLKSSMEEYFDGFEQADGNQRRNQRNIDRIVPAYLDWSQAGTMECNGETHDNGGRGDRREHGAYSKITNTGWHRQADTPGSPSAQYRDGKEHAVSDTKTGGINQCQTNGYRKGYPQDRSGAERKHDETPGNAGFVHSKVQAQVGADWGDIARDAATLAASIESMIEEPQQKKKQAIYPNADTGKKQQKTHRERKWSMER
jgi:hypothetical protein